MRKLFAVAFILLLVVLLAVGCSRIQKETGKQPLEQDDQTEVANDINAADEDSADLSSETAENLDKDLEDFEW